MTTKTKKRIYRIAKHIYRTYKAKVYALAIGLFSILPAILTEDISWLVIGVCLCVALFLSYDE